MIKNYPLFNGVELDQILWNFFPSLPAVYDESFSYLEFLGNVLKNMNEERKHVNEMGEAISLFQKYVLEELQKYDEKIVNKVTEQLNIFIEDGTIANLINQTLFRPLYDKVDSFDSRIKALEYKPPHISITCKPNSTIYEIGNQINSIVINTNIEKGSEDIISYKLFKNSQLIDTNTVGNFVDGDIISNNVTYKVIVTDSLNKTYESNEITISFINKTYYGVNSDISATSDLLNLLSNSGSLELTVSPNGQYIIIMTPTKISSIVIDGIESVSDFNYNEIQYNSHIYHKYTTINKLTGEIKMSVRR